MITKKLDGYTFVWSHTAFGGKGYWFLLVKNGGIGRAASAKEANKLGKPSKEETEENSVDLDGKSEYAAAAKVREKSFGQTIADRVLGGQGAIGAFGGAISDKFKARMTGIKEKFDPLNIARKLTGSGGAAMLGSALGRKKSDISYFTSRKVNTNRDPFLTRYASSGIKDITAGDTTGDVLSKLYSLIKANIKNQKLDAELKDNLKVDSERREERFNKELIKALEERRSGGGISRPSTKVQKDLEKETKEVQSKKPPTIKEKAPQKVPEAKQPAPPKVEAPKSAPKVETPKAPKPEPAKPAPEPAKPQAPKPEPAKPAPEPAKPQAPKPEPAKPAPEPAKPQAPKPEPSKPAPEPAKPSATKIPPVPPVQMGKDVAIGNEVYKGGSVSWRTNNPGNVSYGALAIQYGAIGTWKKPDGDKQQRTTGIAIMPSIEAGDQLKMALWRRPMYIDLPLEKGVNLWVTGNTENPAVNGYAKSLAKAAGVSLDTKVGTLSDTQLRSMIHAQRKWEGYKPGKIEPVGSEKTSTVTSSPNTGNQLNQVSQQNKDLKSQGQGSTTVINNTTNVVKQGDRKENNMTVARNDSPAYTRAL
jgi:hypothetical protein